VRRAPSAKATTAVAAPPPDASAENGQATSFLERARLRRRLSFLRRRRELALREVGGLALEAHRLGTEGPALAVQLAALVELEEERVKLEHALDQRQELAVLREPGLTACPQCSTIHGSEANFCPNCGTKVVRRRAVASPARK
jgi:hypothetical protein